MVTERLDAHYISFYRSYRQPTGQIYYVIDQELHQIYEARPTLNGDFNYVPVSDLLLPGDVLKVAEELRRNWTPMAS
ncbi:MAG TPA: hypothetical protein VGQ81_06405 [Acidobacteriota bacterium]|jgi:hypothetical protein|nr:hypothetical protein [Acidobacteriota bacterium]